MLKVLTYLYSKIAEKRLFSHPLFEGGEGLFTFAARKCKRKGLRRKGRAETRFSTSATIKVQVDILLVLTPAEWLQNEKKKSVNSLSSRRHRHEMSNR